MVPPDSYRVSPAPHYSGYSSSPESLRLQAFHLLWDCFPGSFAFRFYTVYEKSYNPAMCKHITVWAPPRSLATTWGITIVLFSSSYLDVSVRKVHPPTKVGVSRPKPGWVAPFGHPRINASLQLPAAYRSLARPSSSLHTQASPVRPSLLLFTWLAQLIQTPASPCS